VLLELDAVTRLSQAEAPEQLLAPLRQAWLLPSGERLRDGPAVGELDERFHSALVKAAGNDEIARVHDDVTGRIRIVRRLDFTRDDRIDATYQEHARILRAVLQRKADQAKMLLRAHIEQSKAEVRSITLHTLHQAQRRRIA
jgi:DNA-binding GntR family transcriptional regulator